MDTITRIALIVIFLGFLAIAESKSVTEVSDLTVEHNSNNRTNDIVKQTSGVILQPTSITAIFTLIFNIVTFIPRTIIKFLLLIPRIIIHSIKLKIGIAGVIISASLNVARRVIAYIKTILGLFVGLIF